MAMPRYSSRSGARKPANRDSSAVSSGDRVNSMAVAPLPRWVMTLSTSTFGTAYDTSAVTTK
ncbi:MAG TPA: hypothetical protein PLH50_12630 [Ottowia beijingensis]|nr:hypothetical protein [Ottowia beijingensis]